MENNDAPQQEDAIQLVPASLAKRLANYLIDLFIFSFLLSFLLVVVSPVYPLMQKIMAKQPLNEMEQLSLIFVYGLYMSVMEALLKGKTLGKLITSTRAVAMNGRPISSQTAFLRGLIRMIPFEQLSALFALFFPSLPWHDRWSGSIVVDENKSVLPK